jgi:hypothetical protein
MLIVERRAQFRPSQIQPKDEDKRQTLNIEKGERATD